MIFILRNYQTEGNDAVFREFCIHLSTLLVVPTGAGKTSMFADIIRRFLPQRALVIAHREELIFQAKEKIEQIAGVACAIEMADFRVETDLLQRAPCVVTSVQTMSKRFEEFNPMDFGLIVVDECHHTVAKSYVQILTHFKKNPDLRILGVTATPDRADQEALGKIFESVAFSYEIVDCIADGWLTPVEQQMIHVGNLDYSQIRTTCGDLNGADLSKILENENTLQGMIGSAVEVIGTRPTIFFAASIKHAEMAQDIFNRHRVDMAKFVCGKTNKDDRREIMANFSAGKFQVLCNVGVTTEGVDLPTTSVVIMGRPTKSRSLYAQMAGRAFRPLPGCVDGLATPEERRAAIAASGKPSALILDYVGNSGRHKLVSTADILGGKVSTRAMEIAKQRLAASKVPVPVADLFNLVEEELRKEKAEKERLAAEAQRAKLLAKVKFSSEKVSPFDKYGVKYEKANRWNKTRPFTQKMRNVIQAAGYDPDDISYQCGVQVIKQYLNRPASARQVHLLHQHGYYGTYTAREASQMIDAIASNNWQRPDMEVAV